MNVRRAPPRQEATYFGKWRQPDRQAWETNILYPNSIAMMIRSFVAPFRDQRERMTAYRKSLLAGTIVFTMLAGAAQAQNIPFTA